jgi:hypothetical protein
MKSRVVVCGLLAVLLLAWAGVVSGVSSPTVGVNLVPAGVSAEGGREANSLFDGDTESVFSPTEAIRVTVALASPETITRLRVFGPAACRLTVYRPASWGWEPVPSLSHLDLGILSHAWHNLVPAEPFSASSLLLEFVPDQPGENSAAGVRELEIWGDRPLATIASAALLEIPGTPGQLTVEGEGGVRGRTKLRV